MLQLRLTDEVMKNLVRILFSPCNRFNSQEWDAIVIKTGKIDQPEGRALRDYIKDIIQKVSKALDISFVDGKGIEFSITRVFIATNEESTDKAKKPIRAKIEGSEIFIEKKTLVNPFNRLKLHKIN